MVPNSQVLTNPLTNLTAFGSRRSDFDLGVAYGTPLDEAQEIVVAAVKSVPGVDITKSVDTASIPLPEPGTAASAYPEVTFTSVAKSTCGRVDIVVSVKDERAREPLSK